MMRVVMIAVLAVVIAAMALAGVFSPILDNTFTSVGSQKVTANIYAAKNDSTHVLFLSDDSLKVKYYLMVQKYPGQAWQNWGAADSFGPAPGVYTKSWKALASVHYAYAVRCSVVTLDVTSSRVRLRAWETGD